MPSDDSETEYSVFDDEPAENETDDRGTPDARADERPASLGGDGGDGCPKCGGTETETDEIATSGTGLTKMFDVQNRKFLVVSCADCGYSELYKGQSSGNAIDFFLG
ncbi:zinc ribbon domain-containing protein [Halorubrum sp. 2020YC2]|uniref:zinc ribbon domain-containing protein n=1 Tax=Halorubrum sp. 2020YC2 TaxID=2836432 RepID=UPI001BE74130|nr:zinc ribbon domain-containing protein [Halorubrum sp. 2020YC2]QWC19882.1 zinc ribbon domain-containing protein [Halorubrum sp. 2020YC2]